MKPPGIRASSAYFPEVESLRGVAIVLVVLYHADSIICRSEGLSGSIASPVTAFVRAGHTGVSLFFILSGFLLSLPFFTEIAGGARVARRRYYKRRALRILPIYYVAIVVAALCLVRTTVDLTYTVPYFLFLNGIGIPYVGLMPFSGVWWSLATEVQFYAVLPLLPHLVKYRVWWVALAAYLATYGAFLGRSLQLSTIEGQMTLGLSLLGRGPLFLMGAFAAWLFLDRGDAIRTWCLRHPWVQRGTADVALLLVLTALGFLLQWVASRGFWVVETQPLHAWHLVEGSLWTTVLLLILLAPLRLKPVFSNRLLSELGILSYSLYLIHYPVLRPSIDRLRLIGLPWLEGWSGPAAAIVAVLCIACVALSSLTYRLIERPFLVRKARLDG